MHFVLTVCDKAAGKVCPVWPGQPMSAHWGVPDPADVQGDKEAAKKPFADAFMILSRRIALLVNLPLEKLDRLARCKGRRQAPARPAGSIRNRPANTSLA